MTVEENHPGFMESDCVRRLGEDSSFLIDGTIVFHIFGLNSGRLRGSHFPVVETAFHPFCSG